MGTLVSTFYAVVIERSMDATERLWLAIALLAAAAITIQQLLGCNGSPRGALAVLYLAVPSVQVPGYWCILAAGGGCDHRHCGIAYRLSAAH